MKTRRSTIRRLRALWYVARPTDEDLLAGVCAVLIPLLVLAIGAGL